MFIWFTGWRTLCIFYSIRGANKVELQSYEPIMWFSYCDRILYIEVFLQISTQIFYEINTILVLLNTWVFPSNHMYFMRHEWRQHFTLNPLDTAPKKQALFISYVNVRELVTSPHTFAMVGHGRICNIYMVMVHDTCHGWIMEWWWTVVMDAMEKYTYKFWINALSAQYKGYTYSVKREQNMYPLHILRCFFW